MPPDDARRSTLLFVLPLLAVGVGAAAVLLGGTIAPLPPAPAGGLSPNQVTYSDASLAVAIALFALVAFWIFQRLRGNSASMPGRFAVTFLVVLLLVILFLVAVAIVHPAAPTGGTNEGGSPSNTTPTVVTPNATQNGPPSGILPFPDVGPWWAPYAVLAAAAALSGGIAAWMARSPDLPPVTAVPPRPAAVSALRAAIEALGSSGGTDARGRILRAYASLLDAVGTRAGPLDPVTARELADRISVRLGVSRAVAGELTQLFEEARYSSRPIGDAAADRARVALTRALDELRSHRGAG